jgi:hypothetical protein
MKNWLRERVSAILDNFIWFIILLAAPIAYIWIRNWYNNDSQNALLAIILTMLALNLLIGLLLLRRQGKTNAAIRELEESYQWLSPLDMQRNPIDSQVRDEFEITNKYFDEQSSPQRLIVEFTNRGNNTMHVQQIAYSDSGLGLPKTAVLSSYRKGERGKLLIPFNKNNSEVLPGQPFTVEICLNQEWPRDDIYKLAGKWGYLHLDIGFKDQIAKLFTAF